MISKSNSENGGSKLAHQYEMWLKMKNEQSQKEEQKREPSQKKPSGSSGLVMFMLKRMDKQHEF